MNCSSISTKMLTQIELLEEEGNVGGEAEDCQFYLLCRLLM